MTTKRSKFQDIFDATPPEQEGSPDAPPPTAASPTPVAAPQAAAPVAPSVAPPAPSVAPPASAPAQPAPRQGRRAPGKSSDPDYTPVTIYLRKDQYQRVQVRMIELGRKREVSDLIGELLDDWLVSQQASSRSDV